MLQNNDLPDTRTGENACFRTKVKGGYYIFTFNFLSYSDDSCTLCYVLHSDYVGQNLVL